MAETIGFLVAAFIILNLALSYDARASRSTGRPRALVPHARQVARSRMQAHKEVSR